MSAEGDKRQPEKIVEEIGIPAFWFERLRSANAYMPQTDAVGVLVGSAIITSILNGEADIDLATSTQLNSNQREIIREDIIKQHTAFGVEISSVDDETADLVWWREQNRFSHVVDAFLEDHSLQESAGNTFFSHDSARRDALFSLERLYSAAVGILKSPESEEAAKKHREAAEQSSLSDFFRQTNLRGVFTEVEQVVENKAKQIQKETGFKVPNSVIEQLIPKPWSK